MDIKFKVSVGTKWTGPLLSELWKKKNF